MSDFIRHHCGIVLLRLLKPLDYYYNKYGTWKYGVHKLILLMEKQHNRGQDGAGAVNIKLGLDPGKKYIHRYRSNSSTPIKDVIDSINAGFLSAEKEDQEHLNNIEYVKENIPFTGELFLGHLRYGTYGENSIEYVHPVMRENNWRSRNLAIAGNFNLTNVDEQFDHLIELGQHPRDYSDTVTILEKLGHFLDRENEHIFRKYKDLGHTNYEISGFIAKEMSIKKILNESCKKWDGGYTIAGLIGHGDAFVVRDPWGIRPAFYYYDDEIAVATSERPVIQTTFNVPCESVKELQPGHALIIKRDGSISGEKIIKPFKKRSCSFERIYFSRGSDRDIYQERKKLGELLAPVILKAVDHDFKNTVFSFIPNTAETAFLGLVKGSLGYLLAMKKKRLLELGNNITEKDIDEIVFKVPRTEKVAVKDVKLRTFISEDTGREEMVSHVYDITYGSVRKHKDNLVVIDDSIVRGTTLKDSILSILGRLEPKKIIIVSSAPQIRYPDCYGIDMARLGDFIAFQAAIELLRETGREEIIDKVYEKCKNQKGLPKEKMKNYVKEIYRPFTAEEISGKISGILKSDNISMDLQIIYQSIENLHEACPDHLGDWYFTGNYPTPGGNKVVNTAYINYYEGKSERAYQKR